MNTRDADVYLFTEKETFTSNVSQFLSNHPFFSFRSLKKRLAKHDDVTHLYLAHPPSKFDFKFLKIETEEFTKRSFTVYNDMTCHYFWVAVKMTKQTRVVVSILRSLTGTSDWT